MQYDLFSLATSPSGGWRRSLQLVSNVQMTSILFQRCECFMSVQVSSVHISVSSRWTCVALPPDQASSSLSPVGQVITGQLGRKPVHSLVTFVFTLIHKFILLLLLSCKENFFFWLISFTFTKQLNIRAIRFSPQPP